MNEFEILERAAMRYDATQGDLEQLAKWYEENGRQFWNGEGYTGKYNGREYTLCPIMEEDADGDFITTGWEVKYI